MSSVRCWDSSMSNIIRTELEQFFIDGNNDGNNDTILNTHIHPLNNGNDDEDDVEIAIYLRSPMSDYDLFPATPDLFPATPATSPPPLTTPPLPPTSTMPASVVASHHRLSGPHHIEATHRRGPSVFPSFVSPTPPGVPVVLVDCVINADDQTVVPRYAVLGPYHAGLVTRGASLNLTNDRTEVVTVMHNHGVTTEKPWCTVVETQTLAFTEPSPTSYTITTIILLVANALLEPSFPVEPFPTLAYTGEGPTYLLHDRMALLQHVMNYGIPLDVYRCSTIHDVIGEESDENSEQGDYY
ncbi:hypothetical protein DFH09DRAFT_1069888 [Mycena vulgaris]|nr:hypothetical protein DFH09DRAFT_1069888 [Mycena vulgaris]